MKPANALKERKQMNSNTTLLVITIVLFFVLYAAGCVAYAGKGFTTVQTFLNVLRSNAGLICVACGMTCVMLTGGIDISVGSLIAMDCMIIAYGLNNWGWARPPPSSCWCWPSALSSAWCRASAWAIWRFSPLSSAWRACSLPGA